jgi:hypothetical protein
MSKQPDLNSAKPHENDNTPKDEPQTALHVEI